MTHYVVSDSLANLKPLIETRLLIIHRVVRSMRDANHGVPQSILALMQQGYSRLVVTYLITPPPVLGCLFVG